MKTPRLIIHAPKAGESLYWAESPDCPGCFADGDSEAAVRADWEKALKLHLSAYANPEDAFVKAKPPAVPRKRFHLPLGDTFSPRSRDGRELARA